MGDWIYYDSKTGNVDRFVHKLEEETGWRIQKITGDLLVNQVGHLITFTTGRGEIPVTTDQFMQQNHQLIHTVSASGNRNWGLNFGKAADVLSSLYCLPLLFKFELSGSTRDVQSYIEKIINYYDYKEMDIAQ